MATESRQVRRHRERIAAKRATRPGLMGRSALPSIPRADRRNAHIVWSRYVGRTEVYLHATKGLRTRYMGRA